MFKSKRLNETFYNFKESLRVSGRLENIPHHPPLLPLKDTKQRNKYPSKKIMW